MRALAHILSKVPTRADWIVPFLVAALTAAGSFYMASRHDTVEASAAIEQRLQNVERRQGTLEQHQQDQDGSLAHIQVQVDKLVEWALGHK